MDGLLSVTISGIFDFRMFSVLEITVIETICIKQSWLVLDLFLYFLSIYCFSPT